MSAKTKKKDNKLIIFAFLTIVTLAFTAYVVLDKSADKHVLPDTYFIPNIQGKSDEISTIKILNANTNIVLRRRGTRWLIDKMYDYEVDESIVNKLILDVQQLKIFEKKTSNTERFEDLGIMEGSDESFSVRLVMSNVTDDKVYADFIRGKLRGFGRLNTENYIYTRKTNENQAWLVKGGLSYEIDINRFLNKPQFVISKERVMKVSYTAKNGEEYEISRMMPTVDFDIVTPTGKQAESKHQLNVMGEMLDGGVVFDGVRPSKSAGYGDNFVQKVNFRTYDGLEFILTVVEHSGEGVWVKISARAYKNSIEVEAKRINLLAEGWVYKVSDETSDFLLKRISDIEKKPKDKKKK